MSDNGGGDRERWRDAPPPEPRQPQAEPTRAERRADAKAEKARAKAMRPWYRKKRWIAAMAVGLLIVLPALASGGGRDGTQVAETNADGGDAGSAQSEPAVIEEITSEPADKPEPEVIEDEPEEPVEPAETRAQENARRSAENYLQTQAFSKQGLIDQLEFEGYETADAKYGVKAVGADWKEQAARKAEEYLRTQAFSRTGLIDQLKSEGFTTKQATYGVDQAGL